LLVFHAYINEMHSSRNKISSKKSRQLRVFNSRRSVRASVGVSWIIRRELGG
jgi:hypothetical protein